MKYKALTFDANRPIPQQITEPLNSDYGVAVKVYKDEQLVDAALSVGGVETVEGPDGWKLCELSTDSKEGMKILDVEVNKETETTVLSGSAVYENTLTTTRNATFKIYLSSMVDEPIVVDPTTAVLISLKKRAGELSGDYGEWSDLSAAGMLPEHTLTFFGMPEQASQSNKQMALVQNSTFPGVPDNCWYWFKQGAGYQIEFDPKTVPLSVYFQVSYRVDPETKNEVMIEFQSSKVEGLSVSFPLYVQQKDLGYIEVVDNSAEPEPTPDPEE